MFIVVGTNVFKLNIIACDNDINSNLETHHQSVFMKYIDTHH